MTKLILLIICIAVTAGCKNGERTSTGEIPLPTGIPAVQKELYRQRDSVSAQLRSMTAEKLDSSAKAYWTIIQQGERLIPVLLACLTETSPTSVHSECKKGKLNVGEVCYFALEELADFPTYLVTQTQYDLVENDCWNFYTYLFNDKNKSEYQQKARKFYSDYRKTKYQYKKFSKKEMTPCRKMYKIEGRLVWNG